MSKASPVLADDLDFIGRLLAAARAKLDETQRLWDQHSTAKTRAENGLQYLRDPDPDERDGRKQKERRAYLERRAELQEQFVQVTGALSRLETALARRRRVVETLGNYHSAATSIAPRKARHDEALNLLEQIRSELRACESAKARTEHLYQEAVEQGDVETGGTLRSRLPVYDEVLKAITARYDRQSAAAENRRGELAREESQLSIARKPLAELDLADLAISLGVSQSE